ncbi:receptor activity-modifying protein 3-like isoform X2 [Scleropages formosus]|uniref:Receptor activity-modifying protein 3-like n=1 Tax=Scleropages formosus TaxID=113540 RepID=A0A8C9R7S9_SCLFO|nr:receptor activity-modifying protein 3-like isoform X2 [Scleropages formosus]
MNRVVCFLLYLLVFWDVMLQTSVSRGDEALLHTNFSMDNEESFEDPEHYSSLVYCNRSYLMVLYSGLLDYFHENMMELKEESWCDWDQVIRPYVYFTEIMVELTFNRDCVYPNPTAEEVLLQIHRHYFQQCLTQEQHFTDAPREVVLTLMLVPIFLVPIFVFLVVWNNKKQD